VVAAFEINLRKAVRAPQFYQLATSANSFLWQNKT
jgi:hypothetical protein